MEVRKEFLDLGVVFTLQTLRSRNKSGALTAFVWKFFSSFTAETT